MKILLDISPEHYDRLLSEFSEESPMYPILKNDLVIHHTEARNVFKTVEILCEKFHARMILLLLNWFALKPQLRSKRRSEFLARCTEFENCLRTVGRRRSAARGKK